MQEHAEKNKKSELLKVDTMLKVFTAELILKAWAFLGVISHPETQEILEDLPQAKIAIDTIEALIKFEKSFLSDEEIKEIEISLSNLKLNYVSKVNGKKTS